MNINPLLFGFSLQDNVKPKILRLAIYDRTKSLYEQSPKIVALKYTGGRYTTVLPLIQLPYQRVSFSISATDSYTGSTNPNGIYESALSLDGSEILSFRMDAISYNDTRYLNAHIDYRTRILSHFYMQHLSELPGHQKSIYHKFRNDGVIDISQKDFHEILIIVKDVAGNSSTISTRVKYTGSTNDLRVLPGKMFYPLMLDGFEANNCEFFIGEKCLYDSDHIRYNSTLKSNSAAVSDIHTIGASYIPLHEAFTVRIRPDAGISAQQQQLIVMQWTSGSKKDVQKPVWQNGWATARFRDFGNFQLLVDDELPQIIPIAFADGANLSKATRISFTVKDNLGRIKKVRTELDGKWLRFTNDKGRTFVYTFDEKCPTGIHELKVRAEDEAGNVTEKLIRFTR